MLKTLLKMFLVLILPLPSLATSAGKANPTNHFDHVIFIIFENTNYEKAIQQPFFSELASKGAHLSNLKGLTHPSQGNYVGLTSGSLQGIKNDKSIDIDSLNIVDLLEKKGLSWKLYAEDYPGNCFSGDRQGNYVRKHNPFISYDNIRNNSARCANIVGSPDFDKDALHGALPNYVFFVPNLRSDGHDTGVAAADTWLSQKFSAYLNDANFMKNTIFVFTFDEDGGSKDNHIYTSINGPNVRAGIYPDTLNLYSLLKMVEDNWNLGDLGGGDLSAPAVPDIWNK